jgi:hypothetical protein
MLIGYNNIYSPQFATGREPLATGRALHGPLACSQCWLQAQQLTQVCNCSQKQSMAKILMNRAAPP